MKSILRFYLLLLCDALLGLALLLGGCHAVPQAIVLPTTAAVRAPLVSAQTHVARAVAIGKQEAAIVAKAGSAGLSATDTQKVSALLTADAAEKQGAADQLTAALYQVGSLQKDLDAEQAKIVALEKDDAAQTALAKTEAVTIAKERHDFRELFLIFAIFVLGVVIGVSLMGAQLETISRAVEKAVATELLKVGATVVHVAEEIPAVAGGIVKVGAIAAVL